MSELPPQYQPTDAWNQLPPYARLSDTQKDLLLMILNGKPHEEVAETLGISPKTVKNKANEITQKLRTIDGISEALPQYNKLNQIGPILVDLGFLAELPDQS